MFSNSWISQFLQIWFVVVNIVESIIYSRRGKMPSDTSEMILQCCGLLLYRSYIISSDWIKTNNIPISVRVTSVAQGHDYLDDNKVSQNDMGTIKQILKGIVHKHSQGDHISSGHDLKYHINSQWFRYVFFGSGISFIEFGCANWQPLFHQLMQHEYWIHIDFPFEFSVTNSLTHN